MGERIWSENLKICSRRTEISTQTTFRGGIKDDSYGDRVDNRRISLVPVTSKLLACYPSQVAQHAQGNPRETGWIPPRLWMGPLNLHPSTVRGSLHFQRPTIIVPLEFVQLTISQARVNYCMDYLKSICQSSKSYAGISQVGLRVVARFSCPSLSIAFDLP